MTKTLISCTLLALFATMAQAETTDVNSLVAEMRKGGTILYIRHAKTEADYADQLVADPANCGTQRVLSEEGWQQAKKLGADIRALAIPVADVLSSQYCRAWQSADLAFGAYEKHEELNFLKAEDYTPEQTADMRARLLPLMLAPIESGKNRVIMGHDDPFEAVTGIYPEPMGVTYILRQDGSGGVEVLGHIEPDAWPKP